MKPKVTRTVWGVVMMCAAGIILGSGCSGPAGSAEPARLVVSSGPGPAICNVKLAEPDRHGRVWYSKATVSPEEHPPGEILGELRYETDETAVFTGSGVEVWFGSYRYVPISGEPGARGTKYPTLGCPITGRPNEWRPPTGGV